MLYFFSKSDSLPEDSALKEPSPSFFPKNELPDIEPDGGETSAYFFISSERVGFEDGIESPLSPPVVDGESDVLFGSAGGANGEVLLLGIGTNGMPRRFVLNGETIEGVVCTGTSPVRLASLSWATFKLA